MTFRRAEVTELNEILKIIEEGKEFLKKQGIEQWQDGYPNIKTIEKDFKKGESFVLVKGKEVLGTVAVSFDGESSYDKIYNGNWLSNNKYCVIHRMSVSDKYKNMGISSILMGEIEKLCIENEIYNIKVDTHKKNLPMQKLLEKKGFIYCGIIHLDDGDERIAFEKELKKLD